MPDRDRDAWVLAFIEEANALLPEPLPKNFAWTLALSRWVANSHRPTATVALDWFKSRPQPPKRAG